MSTPNRASTMAGDGTTDKVKGTVKEVVGKVRACATASVRSS
jgi:hypothetical protein